MAAARRADRPRILTRAAQALVLLTRLAPAFGADADDAVHVITQSDAYNRQRHHQQ
jgi:hypothetical protein